MEKIDVNFHSDENQIFLNPRLHPELISNLNTLSEQFSAIKGHIWLTTSGSTSNPKLVALSKEAILVSARSVNEILNASSEDTWLIPLPLFHIGGLSIIARAQEAGSRYLVNQSWNAAEFSGICDEHSITMTSLVPTQLFDLLSYEVEAPKSLRAVVIGGGRLSPRLYAKARELHWPILPSFGSTEACSQIATAHLDSLNNCEYPEMYLLPHLKAKTDEDGRLVLSGHSLFTGYASYEGEDPVFSDPKSDGFFVTEDLVLLEQKLAGSSVVPKGRVNDTIKISGELVSITQLNYELEEILHSQKIPGQAVVIAVSDQRLENRIALVGSQPDEILLKLKDLLAERVLPVARPKEVHVISQIPLSHTGKPLFSVIGAALRDGKTKKIYPLNNF